MIPFLADLILDRQAAGRGWGCACGVSYQSASACTRPGPDGRWWLSRAHDAFACVPVLWPFRSSRIVACIIFRWHRSGRVSYIGMTKRERSRLAAPPRRIRFCNFEHLMVETGSALNTVLGSGTFRMCRSRIPLSLRHRPRSCKLPRRFNPGKLLDSAVETHLGMGSGLHCDR